MSGIDRIQKNGVTVAVSLERTRIFRPIATIFARVMVDAGPNRFTIEVISRPLLIYQRKSQPSNRPSRGSSTWRRLLVSTKQRSDRWRKPLSARCRNCASHFVKRSKRGIRDRRFEPLIPSALHSAVSIRVAKRNRSPCRWKTLLNKTASTKHLSICQRFSKRLTSGADGSPRYSPPRIGL